MTDPQNQTDAEKEAAEEEARLEAEKKAAAEAKKASAKAEKEAAVKRAPDETIPGGRYEVNGKLVDANGKALEE